MWIKARLVDCREEGFETTALQSNMPSEEEVRIADILRQLDECGKYIEREINDLTNRGIPDNELDIVGSYAVPAEFKNLMKITQSVVHLPQPPVFHVSTTDKLAGLLKSSSALHNTINNTINNSPTSPNRRNKISVPADLKMISSTIPAASPKSPLVNINLPLKLPSIADINSVKLPNTAPLKIPVIPPNISTAAASTGGVDEGGVKRFKNEYKGPLGKALTIDTTENNDDAKSAIETADTTASPKARRGRVAKDAIELTPTKSDRSASKLNKKTPEPSPRKKKEIEEEVTTTKRKSLRSTTVEHEESPEENVANKKKGFRSNAADNEDEPPTKKRGLRSSAEVEEVKPSKDKDKEKKSPPNTSISTRPKRNVK